MSRRPLNFYGIFTSNQQLTTTGDQEIIEKYRAEETRGAAIGLLVERYQKRLYWHIRKIVISHDDSDDVLQNTFIKAWKGLETFREESSLFTWMYRIATNEALSHLRQKERMRQVSMHPIEHTLAASLESDVYFNGDALQVKLQKAILSLPEKQRIVFNMRYYDEVPYEEMSAILDTSVGALKASYHIAAKKVEEMLRAG